MTASDAELLEPVMTKTATLIHGVRPDQGALPTPCPDLDVGQLVEHVTSWAATFATRLAGADEGAGASDGDTATPVGFESDAARIVGAYRSGTEATARLPVGILLMEFVGHGWDLASATGQRVPYTEDEAHAALAAGRQMLRPEHRGPAKSFAAEVVPDPAAGAVDRLVAFLGRDPAWPADHGPAPG